MNAPIRPSQSRVSTAPAAPVQNQFYVYSSDNNHVGPVNAELIARGVVAGRVPNDAYVAPLGSTSWVPMATIQEIADAVQKERSTPSSMRPTALANGAPTVISPPPALPRDLMNGPTVAATTSSNGTVVSPNPFAPIPTQLSPAANGPASVSPSPAAPPVSQQPVVTPASVPPPAPPALQTTASPGFAQINVPAPQPASIPQQPVAPQPAAPAPAPAPAVASPSISPTPPVGGGEAKKEEKKAALDPRFKFLPLVIFGACAFIGVIETAIVLIAK